MSTFDDFWDEIKAPPADEDPRQIIWDRLEAGDRLRGFRDDEHRPYLQILTRDPIVRVTGTADDIDRGVVTVEAEISLQSIQQETARFRSERAFASARGRDLDDAWRNLIDYVRRDGWRAPYRRGVDDSYDEDFLKFDAEVKRLEAEGSPQPLVGPPTSKLDEWLRQNGQQLTVIRSGGYFEVRLDVKRWRYVPQEAPTPQPDQVTSPLPGPTHFTPPVIRSMTQERRSQLMETVLDMLRPIVPDHMQPGFLSENAVGVFDFKTHTYYTTFGEGRSIVFEEAVEAAFADIEAKEVPHVVVGGAETEIVEEGAQLLAQAPEFLGVAVSGPPSPDGTVTVVPDSVERWLQEAGPPIPQD